MLSQFKWKCDECGKVFAAKSSMVRHSKIHLLQAANDVHGRRGDNHMPEFTDSEDEDTIEEASLKSAIENVLLNKMEKIWK